MFFHQHLNVRRTANFSLLSLAAFVVVVRECSGEARAVSGSLRGCESPQGLDMQSGGARGPSGVPTVSGDLQLSICQVVEVPLC